MVPMNDDAPCAEQLDAAKPRYDYEILGNHDADFLQLQADFDAQNDALAAALARNAELKKERDEARADRFHRYNEALDNAYNERDTAEIDRDAARAELDSLRDRVNALADEWATPGEFRGAGNNLARADCAKELRAALVRGSDDE